MKSIRLPNFFRDHDGNLVIGQMPNLPLIAWLVFTILAHFVTSGPEHNLLSIAGRVSLIVWALLEIFKGDSPFRRTLGVLVLLYLCVSIVLAVVG